MPENLGTVAVPTRVGASSRWTRKKESFVENYLECGNGAEAARRAGYSERNAKATASYLLHNDQAVIEAIEQGRRELQRRHEFTLDKAMDQLKADRDFAHQTENATAAVRATEIMSKMAGHLIERRDVRAQVEVDVADRLRRAMERRNAAQVDDGALLEVQVNGHS